MDNLKNDNGVKIEEITDFNSEYNNEINYIVEEDKESKEDKIKYSDIVFDITIDEKCNSCDVDAFMIIKNNENLFHRFLNTENVFQRHMFGLLKNVIDILK